MEWYVAANLLLSRRAPGFVSAVLSDMAIQAVVVLCDAGRPCTRGRLGTNSIGDGIGYISPGFPPWPTYELQKRSQTTVFLSGPVSMGYSRYVTREGSRPRIIGESRTQDPASPSTADRVAYMIAAAPSLQLSIRDEDRSVIWQDKATLDAAIASFEAEIRSRHARSIDQLRDAGLLSSEEFAKVSTANIRMRIVDLRTVKTPL